VVEKLILLPALGIRKKITLGEGGKTPKLDLYFVNHLGIYTNPLQSISARIHKQSNC